MKRYIKSDNDILVQQYLDHLKTNVTLAELSNYLGRNLTIKEIRSNPHKVQEEIDNRVNTIPQDTLYNLATSWKKENTRKDIFTWN